MAGPVGLAWTDVLGRAGDFLLLREFEKCLLLCEKCKEAAKIGDDQRPPQMNKQSLCIIAIQAFAELNRWNEVLTFVTDVYGGIDKSPGKVVQLCLLLHSRVKDYTTCHAIASFWLQNVENQSSPEYATLVNIFIFHVLIPQQNWQGIQPFLTNFCKGLCSVQKEEMLKNVQHYQEKLKKRQMKQKMREEIDKNSDYNDTGLDELGKSFPEKAADMTLKSIQALTSWRSVKSLILICFVCAIIAKYATGSNQLSNAWKCCVQLWKMMFYPYHLVK